MIDYSYYSLVYMTLITNILWGRGPGFLALAQVGVKGEEPDSTAPSQVGTR